MEGMVGPIVAGAIVYALFLAVGGGYAYYSTESRERNKAKIVAAAAQQLGFTGGRGTISGVRGGYRVEVSVADNHENKKVYPEILVGSPGDQGFLPRPLALPWEFDPNDDWLTNSLLGTNIGGDAFDRCFRVDALDSAFLAPLDASPRDLLLEARELKGELTEEGAVSLTTEDQVKNTKPGLRKRGLTLAGTSSTTMIPAGAVQVLMPSSISTPHPALSRKGRGIPVSLPARKGARDVNRNSSPPVRGRGSRCRGAELLPNYSPSVDGDRPESTA